VWWWLNGFLGLLSDRVKRNFSENRGPNLKFPRYFVRYRSRYKHTVSTSKSEADKSPHRQILGPAKTYSRPRRTLTNKYSRINHRTFASRIPSSVTSQCILITNRPSPDIRDDSATAIAFVLPGRVFWLLLLKPAPGGGSCLGTLGADLVSLLV
jgi:hypothetical protein